MWWWRSSFGRLLAAVAVVALVMLGEPTSSERVAAVSGSLEEGRPWVGWEGEVAVEGDERVPAEGGEEDEDDGREEEDASEPEDVDVDVDVEVEVVIVRSRSC